MKKWPFLVVGILALVLVSWWFWSLGNLPADAPPRITLKVEQGQVLVRSASDATGEWRTAKDGDALFEGDDVRTGAGSAASIQWFGKGESRLQEDSEIHLDGASADSGQQALDLNIQLKAGRIWSRILRLLDLDSSVAVRTNAVVATVRGTAFDLNAQSTGTVVWVSDAAVQVTGSGFDGAAPTPAPPLVLTSGFMATFDLGGTVVSSQPISDEAKQGQWFTSNTKRDEQFLEVTRDSVMKRLAAEGGTSPDSLLDGFTKLSERLHLSLASQKADDLFARYAERRLFAIMRLVDAGKSGLAFQAYSSLEEEIHARVAAHSGNSLALKRRIGELRFLFEDKGPSDSLYRLKQRLEDLDVMLSSSDQARVAYARLVAIDSRLDEAAMLITQSSLDDAKSALDTAREGIGNEERDIDHLPTTVGDTELQSLRGKLFALKARETSIRTRLATAIVPPTNQKLDDGGLTATSTTSTIADVDAASSTHAATTTVSEITKITLRAQPSPVQMGDIVTLSVMGTRADGTTADVTAKSQFSLSGNLGSLNGPTYSATAPGSVTITATYKSGATTLTSLVPLQILAKATALTALTVTANGPTTLSGGQQVALSVKATYGDGSTKDVTATAQYVSSNPSLGSLKANVLSDISTAPGSVRVTATYAEAGITKTAFIDFTLR